MKNYFSELKGCPGEPVLAGKGFLTAIVTLRIAVSVGVSLAQVSAAILALRAIGNAINMVLAACLFAICTVRAVLGICYVACTGTCIALLALRAVGSSCNVCSTFDGLVAVHADRAIFCRSLVRLAGNCGATNGACGVANVDIAMSRAGNCFRAVLANRAIRCKRSVSVARTNVIAVVTSYVVLIVVDMRRRTLESAIAVASCIADGPRWR